MTNIRTFIFLGVVMSVTTFASYEASIKSFNGNIGIGTTSPSQKLEVAGTVSASVLQVNGTANITQRYVDKTGLVMPVGSIIAFGGTNAPSGWLICNGALVSRTTYADLYTAIGTNFGYGDNSTTFALPDMRGRFLRGVDGGTARDPDKATRTAMNTGGNTGDNIGSVEGDAIQGHWHNTFLMPFGAGGGSAGISWSSPSSYTNVTREPISDGTNGTPRVSSETRPTNANVNYIIKY